MSDWVPVNSSNLEAASYDPDKQELGIRFRNGSVYTYGGVPEGVAQALLHADSPGRYFNENIKSAYPQANSY